MIGKIVLVAMQVAGIYGAINLTPEQKGSLHTFVPLACGKYGAADKAPAAEAGVLQFVDCLGELYDYDNITMEMTMAIHDGNIHSVMEGYCKKAPQVKKCILEVLERILPCTPPMLQVNKDIQIKVTDNLLQWICADKGDKVALFILEHGKECLVKSMQSIRDCTGDFKSSIIKNLDLKTKCTNFEDMSNCVVATMLFCQTNVTAVMFNSMFESIREMSLCKQYIKPFGLPKMKQK